MIRVREVNANVQDEDLMMRNDNVDVDSCLTNNTGGK
jgi:hypothetical protein